MKMRTERRALDKIYRRRDRYEIPEWQRDEVWPVDKKQLLIDTILRGWTLPKFYFAKVPDEQGEFEVVDGQQRLMTVFEFFEGQLRLSTTSAKKFGGSSYDELSDSLKDAFDDYEISYDELTDASEEELKEFFRRLQGGLTLTASEKLNAIHSNLTNFARQLSHSTFFKEKTAIRDTRKAYFDIAAKVAAIEVDGIETGLRFEDLSSTFTANAGFSPASNTGKRLKRTFDFLDRIFPSRNASLRNRSTIQSFATLAAEIVAENQDKGSEQRLLSFFEHFDKELSTQVELGPDATDSDYIIFQRTLSANVKAGSKIRHQILLRKLLLFDPGSLELLGSSAISKSGLRTDISRIGESIGSLIETINEAYSAKNGEDLFKATNRTAAAIGRSRKPIADFDSYKTFIDDLYFIFHEGVGQRLAGKVPKSFVDVKDLRTAIQHDLDHGKPSAVAAKRIKFGQTFKRYGGEGAPAGLAPERFPIVQASVLSAIEADLHRLV
jgi:Protein of unknown function DUF262